MSEQSKPTDFDTGFGMLHSLSILEREARRLISEASHQLECVATGLQSGQLPSDRAVVIVREAIATLKKLSR
ncbi:MAG: hypothetical protein WCH39_17600 [Schlesneria sp.]